jgi:hypothetical protein
MTNGSGKTQKGNYLQANFELYQGGPHLLPDLKSECFQPILKRIEKIQQLEEDKKKSFF